MTRLYWNAAALSLLACTSISAGSHAAANIESGATMLFDESPEQRREAPPMQLEHLLCLSRHLRVKDIASATADLKHVTTGIESTELVTQQGNKFWALMVGPLDVSGTTMVILKITTPIQSNSGFTYDEASFHIDESQNMADRARFSNDGRSSNQLIGMQRAYNFAKALTKCRILRMKMQGTKVASFFQQPTFN